MIDWLRDLPEGPARARLVLAHGAGAPMGSEFMNAMAEQLVAGGLEVWRFEFPYMAARRSGGPKRPPDGQARLLESWQQAIADAREVLPPDLPLLIGGKSMGGRMASLIADREMVSGLVCLGYPFHPPGKPEKPRIEHLETLQTPTLIVQGSRDRLGSREEVAAYSLAEKIRIVWLEDGDHDFKPRVKSGFSQEQHWQTAAEAILNFANRANRYACPKAISR